MIDSRFRLAPSEHKHLHHLQFKVDIPLDKNYKKSDTESVIAICSEQYPELVFNCAGDFYTYNARFPDGQYASGTVETTQSAHTDFSYVKTILFSLPLGLDDIMAGVCSFKKAVPPLNVNVQVEELLDLTPDDFYERVENLYASEHSLSLRIRAISWQFSRVSGSTPIYLITPTDYDYI